MKIKFIYTHLFDVFWGDGWKNWARIHRTTTGFPKQIAGGTIPREIFKQLLNKDAK